VEADGDAERAAALRSLLRGLTVLLALAAVGFAGFDALVTRPAMTAFARAGRPASGKALALTSRVKAVSPRRGSRAIAVDDAELGEQLVDGDGSEREGESVAVLCSTPIGRCERAALVAAYVERWPRTPAMARAAALVALAAIGGYASRRVSRRARRSP
jgi:hypothetical protein